MAHRIFVLDDDADLLEIIGDFLKDEGYGVDQATDPEAALPIIRDRLPALLLLDVRMKGMSGLEVCRRLKGDARTAGVLIVLMSVKTDVSDVVVGLEMGAEDYIRKPIVREELLARLKAVLRRADPAESPPAIEVGPLRIDFATYAATLAGQPLRLAPKEFELLAYLARREGRLVTRGAISTHVWERDHVPTSRTIEDHMYRLRKKLGPYGHWIQGLKGVGYRFEVE